MNIKFLSSYDRSFDKLSESVQSEVADIEEELIASLETGAKPSKGLGLKKLKRDYWEARVDLKLRILFRLKRDLLVFVLIGNHDEIRRYLRGVEFQIYSPPQFQIYSPLFLCELSAPSVRTFSHQHASV